jgi:hypothetical protein
VGGLFYNTIRDEFNSSKKKFSKDFFKGVKTIEISPWKEARHT